MDFDFYQDKVTIKDKVYSCARKAKEGILYIPHTEPVNIQLGVSAFLTVGNQVLELKILDVATHPSQGIGTHHPHILELHTENITAAPYKVKEATQMISIGTLSAQQVQVGNNNAQTVNITLEQLTREVSKSDDPAAKGILRALLENPTISSVIGGGVSGLIGLL